MNNKIYVLIKNCWHDESFDPLILGAYKDYKKAKRLAKAANYLIMRLRRHIYIFSRRLRPRFRQGFPTLW